MSHLLKQQHRTISRDLITALVTGITISSIFITTVHFWILSVQTKSDFEKKADEYVTYLQESLQMPMWTFDGATVEKICETFLKNDVVCRIKAANYLGDVLFEKQKPDRSKLLVREGKIIHQNRLIGSIEIGLTREYYLQNIYRLMISNLLYMLVTIIVIIGVTRFFVLIYLQRPLHDLMECIRGIRAGNFKYPEKDYRQKEIVGIIREFYQMIEEVDHRERALNHLNDEYRMEIKERKQAEMQLRNSERRMAQIINFLPDPTFVIDAESRVIAWNHAIEKLTGVKASEMINRGHYKYALPFYHERRPVLIDLVRYWDEETSRKYVYVQKKGDTLVSETRNPPFRKGESCFWNAACPLYDEKKRIIGAIETIRDITEIKRVEESLRKSEFRFRSLFNSSPDGIVLADFSGKMIDVNKSLAIMTGFEKKDLLHRHIKSLAPAAYHEGFCEFLESVKAGFIPKDEPIELEYLKSDGDTAPAVIRLWVVTDEKSIGIAIGAFITDISRQKSMAEEKEKLERQLQHMQKMEAVGTLAGGIAHDFNNILGGIVGYAEMIPLKLETGNADINRYVSRILEAGERARDLVQQILQFSRQDQSPMGPVQVKPLLKEVIKLLGATIPKSIEIRSLIAVDRQTVMGDATQIHQVIMNLCTNACHAMRDGGGILTVGLKQVALEHSRRFQSCEILPGQYLCLTVEDTGTGIPHQIMERIFEPYFTTKKVNEGTGLGLSVTLGIVRKHGGLVEPVSVPEKGTMFKVFLPISNNAAGQKVSRSDSYPKGNNERILLVDDEPFFVDIVHEHLESMGYSSSAFQNSLDALAFFKTDPFAFDLVITDQSMPKMNGIELVAEIRKLNPTVPIILCTGFSENVTEQTVSHYSISKFLLKPVTGKDLADAVFGAISAGK